MARFNQTKIRLLDYLKDKWLKCSLCDDAYHFACNLTISTYFRTPKTWKCSRCKIILTTRGRGRGRMIVEEDATNTQNLTNTT